MLHAGTSSHRAPYREDFWAENVAAGIARKPAPVALGVEVGESTDAFYPMESCRDQTFEIVSESQLPPEQEGLVLMIEQKPYGLRFVVCHVMLNLPPHTGEAFLDGCLEGHAAKTAGEWKLSDVIVGTGEDEAPAESEDSEEG